MTQLSIVAVGKASSAPDWLHFLLGDLVGQVGASPDWPDPQPGTLYCVDTNWNPLSTIPPRFLDLAGRTPGVGLFHSDEWLLDDYATYRSFAFVMRFHRAAAIEGPGIRSLPLGWPNRGRGPGLGQPASARRNTWFFAGNLISSRPEMVKAFRKVPGGLDLAYNKGSFDAPPSLPFDEYLRVLGDTAIIPAGMGNVVLETWRLYEALENGCIPIIERRVLLDYYKGLLGPHPIPAFLSWHAAAAFVRGLLRDPARLDALQAEIQAWWQAFKPRAADDTRAFVAAGMRDEFRPAMRAFQFPTGWRRSVWQYSELLRHQTLPSVTRRVLKAASRGSIRRDLSHLDKVAGGGEGIATQALDSAK